MDNAPHSTEDHSAGDRVSSVIFELTEPLWAVVTFDMCVATDLIYEQAVDLMEHLADDDVSGVCIVTNETAERMLAKQRGAARI